MNPRRSQSLDLRKVYYGGKIVKYLQTYRKFLVRREEQLTIRASYHLPASARYSVCLLESCLLEANHHFGADGKKALAAEFRPSGTIQYALLPKYGKDTCRVQAKSEIVEMRLEQQRTILEFAFYLDILRTSA